MSQTFMQDCIERANNALESGKIDRRAFLTVMAATGLLAATGGRALSAEEKELIFVGWGGLANDAYQKCYAEPFMAANPGIKVVQDTSGAAPGTIRSMVESGNVTWDIGDSSAPVASMLGKQGFLEKVDYSVVNKEDVVSPAYAQEYGATPLAFSSIIVYDSEKYPEAPKGWADFYDFERFPGRRAMQKDAEVMMDTLQLGLGRDPAALYPLDVDACLAKLKEIKDNVIFWDSGSQSEEMMRSGEADMGILWQSRAFAVVKDSGDRLKATWNQGILQAGSFVIPKGAPLVADAQRLLASMLALPEPQVEALKLLGTGPTNPKAAALVPAELRPVNPLDPDNRALQIELNAEWWGDNYAKVNEAYLEAITG